MGGGVDGCKARWVLDQWTTEQYGTVRDSTGQYGTVRVHVLLTLVIITKLLD